MAAQPTVLNIQILSPPIHSPPTQQVLGKRAAGSDDVTVQIDVSRPIPYPPTPEVVEALRQRILHLESELAGAQRSTSKKAKTAPTTVQTTLPVASGSGFGFGLGSGYGSGATLKNEKAEKAEKAEIAKMEKESAKTRKSRGKSLFDQLKKAARAEKYQGGPRLVKFEDHFTQADFDTVFGGCGVLVQPTPDNKPTSKVYIRKYTSESDYEALFGDANYKRDQLKGFQWTVGGIHAGKSQKMGQVQLIITSIEIQWSKNTDKLVFKAEVVQEGGCGSGGYDWLDMDGDFGMGGRKRSFW